MKKFETFYFESFDFDEENFQGKFYYSFDEGAEVFEEVIDFGASVEMLHATSLQNKTILDNFLFNLHLALGISYYKLFPTKNLVVKSGFLDEDQKKFWEKFYKNGLGEFFITNQIDPNGLVNFDNSNNSPSIEAITLRNNYIESSSHFVEGKNLLLWGGGKDSIVSYSLLSSSSLGGEVPGKWDGGIKDFDLFVFGKIDDIKQHTAEVLGKKVFLVKRLLSKNLFKLNEQGYYNGHVPITGIIAFVTFVVGYLYGYSNIILSNEKSASEENTIWKGLKVNHQYSKSLEFEQDLREYTQHYMTQGIYYFSLLRGMYEYKIAEIFSKQKDFFGSFSSCNRNFKISPLSLTLGGKDAGKADRGKPWCCECEKCCFVFLILSAFLEEKDLVAIFGKNLFEKKELETIFKELIGLENYKPFECVGTYDECLLSAKKAIKKYTLSFEKEVFEICDDDTEKKLENKLLKISDEDIIPEKFKRLIK